MLLRATSSATVWKSSSLLSSSSVCFASSCSSRGVAAAFGKSNNNNNNKRVVAVTTTRRRSYALKTTSAIMSNNNNGRYHATAPDAYQSPTLTFDDSSKAFGENKEQLYDRLSFIGKPQALRNAFKDQRLSENVDEKTMKLIEAFLESCKKDKASSTIIPTGWRENEKKKTVVQEIAIGVLPTTVSRHNDASGAHGLQDIAKGTCGDGKTRRVVIASENESDFGSLVNALTRAFPVFSMKSKVFITRNVICYKIRMSLIWFFYRSKH